MGSVLKPIQTLKEYFLCHVSGAHLGTTWYQIIGASRRVSNKEYSAALSSCSNVREFIGS